MKTEINCAVLGSEICVEIVDVRLDILRCFFSLLLLGPHGFGFASPEKKNVY